MGGSASPPAPEARSAEGVLDDVQAFERSVQGIEGAVDDLLEAVKTANRSAKTSGKRAEDTGAPSDDKEGEELPPLERARIHITLAYAANSLLYMYLMTQGVDASKHPVREELERVKSAYLKLQRLSAESAAGDGDAALEDAPARLTREGERPKDRAVDMAAGSRLIAAHVDVDRGVKERIRSIGKRKKARRHAAEAGASSNTASPPAEAPAAEAAKLGDASPSARQRKKSKRRSADAP